MSKIAISARTDITVHARDVAAIDLMDEAIAALRLVHEVMFDADLTNVPMGAEAASVLWDALEKLSPVREHLNGLHGAA
ncbi:MAG: hypothetical protein J0I08_06745 [Rhizobiales bacterium]|nr:hypothetical protein [Hyphomicrobiales bacterium]